MNEIIDKVLGGEADEYLNELREAVNSRRKVVAARVVSGVKVGDRIRFNENTRPKYLQGIEAVVVEKLQKNVRVEMAETAGRYTAGMPITVPAILVEVV